MLMPPGLRKSVLTAHVTSSVDWLGAVAVALALAIVGLTSQDAQTVRAAYLVMEPVAWSSSSRFGLGRFIVHGAGKKHGEVVDLHPEFRDDVG